MCLIALFLPSSFLCSCSLLFLLDLHDRIYLMLPGHSMTRYWFLFPLLCWWVSGGGIQGHFVVAFCSFFHVLTLVRPIHTSLNCPFLCVLPTWQNKVCLHGLQDFPPEQQGALTSQQSLWIVMKISHWLTPERLGKPCILNSWKMLKFSSGLMEFKMAVDTVTWIEIRAKSTYNVLFTAASQE